MIDQRFAMDYQVHSYCSHDGKATIQEQCMRAVKLGLDEIGFSEHKDFNPEDPLTNYFDYDHYVREIILARAEFAGCLTIRMGVEVDYQEPFEQMLVNYLSNHEFDFVIGSVHHVDGAMLMTPEYTQGRYADAAYRTYYEAILHSVECGSIDILGHLEYANRRGVTAYGPFDPSPYYDQVSKIFDAMIEHNVALEINSAGWRQGTGHSYPCEAHVALYRQRGGRLLTFGSDAHEPHDLADQYSKAMELAERCGFSELTTYQNRQPRQRLIEP